MRTEATFKRSLPFVVENGCARGKWQLVNSSWSHAADAILKVVENPDLLPSNAYYKNETRRLIFHFPSIGGAPDVVVKGFPLGEWRHRIRYKKYAYSEAQNLITAKRCGLPVPEVLGYGYGCRCALLRWVAVIMEYIPFPSMRDDFVRGLSEEETWGHLRRTIPSFRKLYLAGCNHIDFGPHSIMMSPNGAEEDVLIDFQYASFFEKPSAGTIASQLGYFGWAVGTNRDWVGPAMRDQWYSEVLKALEIPFSKKIRTIVRESEVKRRSTRERLRGYQD